MSIELKITAIVSILFLIVLILHYVKQEKILVKYSLVWLLPCIVLLIFVLVPGFLTWTTNLLGFQTASNMILTLLVGLLFIITMSLTVIVSTQKEQIRLLIQEISILKKDKISKEKEWYNEKK